MAGRRQKKTNAPKEQPRRAWVTSVPGAAPQGLLIAQTGWVFQQLGVGCSVWRPGEWLPIHANPGVLKIEQELRLISERYAHNDKLMSQAWSTQRAARGMHRGMLDFVVPVVSAGETRAVMVSGPIAPSWPNSASVLPAWRSLTGRQGHPADPEFARYLSLVLETLVLDQRQADEFQRLLECLAESIVLEGRAPALQAEIRTLTRNLTTARRANEVWRAARDMVDPRTSGMWSTSMLEDRLPGLGLGRCPNLVAVGLMVAASPEADPVDDLLRKHAFQRACIDLAQARGDAISGQLGEHGVTLLASFGNTGAGKRKLLELCDEATRRARRQFALRVHFGISAQPLPLPAQYQAALGAAEAALSENRTLLTARSMQTPRSSLRALRSELSDLMERDPALVPPRFEHFLDAVAARTTHRVEPARVHLEAAFERLTDPLLRAGTLDERALNELEKDLEQLARKATTLSDLFSVYRAPLATWCNPDNHRTTRTTSVACSAPRSTSPSTTPNRSRSPRSRGWLALPQATFRPCSASTRGRPSSATSSGSGCSAPRLCCSTRASVCRRSRSFQASLARLI